jgi:hypothetical protein
VRPLPAAGLDLLAVVLFVVLGRRSHAEGLDLAGIAGTAWPFLAALVVGGTAARAWRSPLDLLRTGVPVWLVTAWGGLLLRRLTGGGTPADFVLVATLVLGALLLGWRAAARLRRRA